MKSRISPAEFVRRHWLLLGILWCIFLAAIYPSFGSKKGPLRTEYTVKYGAVSVIFFISGMSMKSDSIFRTFQQKELHLFIQFYTFLFIPIFTYLSIQVLRHFGLNSWILKGLTTVSCMPPPVSSAVILTRAAQGNETAAIFNSILGSFLGIILTPMLLLTFLGSTTVVPLVGTVIQLTTTVLVPLILGQLLRNFTRFRGHRLPLNAISQIALLFVIYTTFCDTFETPEVGISAMDILQTVFLVLLMQIILMVISFNMGQYFKKTFRREDIIAILFCSTHKSLTLGIPILRIMFHGLSHLSQISLPLLVYHPTQIILGGLLASHLKVWGYSRRSEKLPL